MIDPTDDVRGEGEIGGTLGGAEGLVEDHRPELGEDFKEREAQPGWANLIGVAEHPRDAEDVVGAGGGEAGESSDDDGPPQSAMTMRTAGQSSRAA